ncbi:MAG: TIM-barrel domain-containing protein, partial [Actinomycetota bacterium]
MSDFFRHVPEGDHNPYEPTPWARNPLLPTAQDPISIGVTVPEGCTDVHVEWEYGDSGPITTPLERRGDGWHCLIGPMSQSGRYRFLGPDEHGTQQASEWFDVPILDWVRHAGITINETDISEEALDLRVEASDADSSDDRGNHLASTRVGELLDGFSVDVGISDGSPSHLRISWTLGPEEAVFGTGERFDSLNQRGHTPDVRVYEQYKQQGSRTYLPIPWILSSLGYGISFQTSDRIRFDIGSTETNRITVVVPAPTVEARIYLGSPADVLKRYADDVGRPPILPPWVYGPWMSGNEWDRQSRVNEVVDKTLTEGIPATVLVIEAWSDETTFYLFNDTDYAPTSGNLAIEPANMTHTGRWPDPKAMVDSLHDNDIRVLLWQIPVLKDIPDHPQHDNDVAHASANDFCVKTEDRSDYRNRGWWFPGSRIIDFTNPDARDWWLAKRRYLVRDLGIDGFKTDGGEHLWGADVRTHDGTHGDAAANEYPLRYLAAYHELLEERQPEQLLTFSRAGFTGTQALPAHWAGDEDSTWEALQASLTAGLSAATSGISYWTWDLGGFSGPLPSAELYKRSTAFAAFCPLMQYHSEHNEHKAPLADRTPWNIATQTDDPAVVDIYRFYARLRMNLIPYLYTSGAASSHGGLPIMRPMFLEHPEAVDIDDQYKLGDALCVAPVTEEGSTQRTVVLPDGIWFDFWTGNQV